MEVYNEWEVESWELHVETPGQIIDDEAQTEDKADDSSNSSKIIRTVQTTPLMITGSYQPIIDTQQVVLVLETTSCCAFSLVSQLELATYVLVPRKRSM